MKILFLLMRVTIPIFFIFFILLFSSCKNSEKQDAVKAYSETDNGDSIIYYRDFDLYSFKGIDKLNPDSLRYPFVKMIYKNDSLVLKAHYNKSKAYHLLLLKLNGQWSNHFQHWGDGVTSHHFLVFTDTALYEFKFHRNPYGKTLEDLKRPARLYNITIESKKKDVINYRYYQSFDWGTADYKEVPDLTRTNEKDWLENCQSFITCEIKIKNDSLRKVCQNYERAYKGGKYSELEKDGDDFVITVPLVFHSEFYTRFLRMNR
jgi:hypothetical protein